MTGRFLRSIAGVAAAWLLGVGIASAQAPALAQPGVSGNNVTFTWSATAGATGYRLDYGVGSGAYLGGLTLGNVTSYSIAAPNGVFFIRIVALPGGETSNEITLQVPAPPSAPTGLVVSRNGRGVIATWAPGSGGGTPTGYQLIASLTSGGADFVIPSVAPAFGGGPAPATTLYFRAVAVNAAGQSGPSPEVIDHHAGSGRLRPGAPGAALDLRVQRLPERLVAVDCRRNAVRAVGEAQRPGARAVRIPDVGHAHRARRAARLLRAVGEGLHLVRRPVARQPGHRPQRRRAAGRPAFARSGARPAPVAARLRPRRDQRPRGGAP